MTVTNYQIGAERLIELKDTFAKEGHNISDKIAIAIIGILDADILDDDEKFNEFIEFGLALFVMGIQENEVSLKTKEDALTELDFLRTNPGDVSKNRLFNFLREVVSAEGPKTLSSQLKIPEEEISKNLSRNAWVEGMSDDLYNALKRFINASYLETK